MMTILLSFRDLSECSVLPANIKSKVDCSFGNQSMLRLSFQKIVELLERRQEATNVLSSRWNSEVKTF